jgi:Sec-independent protein translocase protein TatA
MEHGFIGLLFILVAVVLIFGGRRKLEDLGAGFGGFMREFNKARREIDEPAAPPKKAARKPVKKKAPARKKG